MKAIKKINNNIAVCLDKQNHEVIAIGKGIGFPEMPYEISDLSKIERTFYDVDSTYVEIANQIPDIILEAAAEIVDQVRLIVDRPISSNLVFTLADHIKFAIDRKNSGMIITAPLQYDIQHLYSDDYDLGVMSLEIIQRRLQVRLPAEEATNLALHFINAKLMMEKELSAVDDNSLIEEITEIISDYFKVYIDKHSFNYSRFVTHLQYLLKRQHQNVFIKSDNKELYDSMTKKFPETSDCVDQIAIFFKKQLDFQLEQEERLYLMLHINRLCMRERL